MSPQEESLGEGPAKGAASTSLTTNTITKAISETENKLWSTPERHAVPDLLLTVTPRGKQAAADVPRRVLQDPEGVDDLSCPDLTAGLLDFDVSTWISAPSEVSTNNKATSH